MLYAWRMPRPLKASDITYPPPQPSAAVINSSRTIYLSIFASAARRAAEDLLTSSSISFMLSLFLLVFASSRTAWASAAAISSTSTSSSMVAYSFLSFFETLTFFFPFSNFCWSSMALPSLSSDRCDGFGTAFVGGTVFAGLGSSGGSIGFGFGVCRNAVVLSAATTMGTVAIVSDGGIGAFTGSGGGESKPVMYLVNPGAAPPPALRAVKYSE
mmetsp:Transcript_33066/g.51185  ORF Transcript_33066/g.51185 Transcript_33066/m.51185 type:complete len:214 (-) Transcript_33066:819-1460(-)